MPQRLTVRMLSLALALLAILGGVLSLPLMLDAPPVMAQGGPSGWSDDGTVVRLVTSTDQVGIGTATPAAKLDVVGNIAVSGTVDGFDIGAKGANWDLAFNERRQWDGSGAFLDPALGRASLGLGSLAVLSVVSGGTGGTIADGTITNDDLAAGSFPKVTAVGTLNNVVLRDSDGPNCHKLTINSAGTLATTAVDCTTGDPLPVTVAADNFESYADGALWNGLAGGSGWTGNWDEFDPEVGTNNSIVSTPTLQGVRSGRTYADSGGSFGVRRSFPAVVNGTATLIARKAAISSGPPGHIRLKEGASVRCEIVFDSDGNIKINNNGALETIQAYAADTNYTVEISFDATTDTYKARVDGGPFTAAKTVVGGAMAQADTFEIHRPQVVNGHFFWIDAIEIKD